MARFISLNKGGLVNAFVGVSSRPEKSFKRSVLCIKENGSIYKIISTCSNKKDGSLNVFFPYCKESKSYIFRHLYKYSGGITKVNKDQITKEYIVDKTTKLSIHRSGFVQLSGNGIISGIDRTTGLPKGVGVFSSPLDTPVDSGPTFSFQCWGISEQFELLKKQDKDCQYIILDRNKDFTEKLILKDRKTNCYSFEFFIFPKEANSFVFEHENKPFINHKIANYIFQPGAQFTHPVLDIKFFKEVVCVFPSLTQVDFSSSFGYMLNSPGGADTINDESKTGNNFHLICPRSAISTKGDNVEKLEYSEIIYPPNG